LEGEVMEEIVEEAVAEEMVVRQAVAVEAEQVTLVPLELIFRTSIMWTNIIGCTWHKAKKAKHNIQ
jgi:hypothetical protein